VFLGVVFAAAIGLTGAGTETVVVPLLATQILWINLVTDSGPALAMGVDPEIDDVMARAPRSSKRTDHRPPDVDGYPDHRPRHGRGTLFTIDIFLARRPRRGPGFPRSWHAPPASPPWFSRSCSTPSTPVGDHHGLPRVVS